MNIIENRNLILDVFDYDVILVGVSTYNKMGNGFQRDIRVNFKDAHNQLIETKYGDPRKLGTILHIERKPIIVCCFITKGYNFRPDKESDYLDYEALEKCLKKINRNYKGKNVATPILGVSKYDGNGDKEKIIEIFKKNTNNINLTLYDYEQVDEDAEYKKKFRELVKNRKEEKLTYQEYANLKKTLIWERKHGIYNGTWNSPSL